MEAKAKFVEEAEEKVQKLWMDFATMNAEIDNSMKSINGRTNELMEVLNDGTGEWVEKVAEAMRNMTIIMNQCESITQDFKQIEQVAEQTEKLKDSVLNVLHKAETSEFKQL